MRSENPIPPWFEELRDLVQAKLAEGSEIDDGRRTALAEEYRELSGRIEGWEISLGSTDVPHSLRESLHRRIAEAERRRVVIEEELRICDTRRQVACTFISESVVQESLGRLSEILAKESATLGNLILSSHIDRIVVHPDGRAVVRTCKLGSTPEAIPLMQSVIEDLDESISASAAERRVRRRTLLNVDRLDPRAAEYVALAEFAADPNRFAGLPDEFFWTDEFLPEERTATGWSVENADRVKQYVDAYLDEHGVEPSGYRLGKEFKVAAVTARRALAIARGEARPATSRRPRTDSVKVKGNATVEAEILRLHDVEGLQIKLIAERIGCGKKAVTDALDRLYAAQGRTRADARSRNGRAH